MTRETDITDRAVAAAKAVMQAHITALNSRDQAAIAATLHFPHVRLSGTTLKIWDSEDTYFADFLARAGGDWHHSAFADIRMLRAAADKVHLDAEIRRFAADGSLITSFRSLWVITCEAGRWAAKMRSSFAAA
ncbi:MAG: hypothetical protein VXY13_05725 [Pseudomonadota bacterium]|nr:hypothetical protein [Pseudomonadota bacterium]MEC8673225.1 hypothetical protein [Pseudomonadota bacterium]